MSKTVIPFTVKLVSVDTTVPFAEVTSRLNVEVNKEKSSDIMSKFKLVKNQEEFKAAVEHATGERDFLYFTEVPQHRLLELLDGVAKPAAFLYTIGNPLIAQAILQYNRLAAYNVPLRLLVLEKADGTGTTVSYHLPSTVLGVPGGVNDPALQTILDALDRKLERLADVITKH
ncbi:hypothetical protein B0H34DRAFT_793793 [Crassisporium funariophilum]|nr:hypothetical protein B0H34DRAFT_793793 [Crassisporium funariophilum]